LQQQVVVDKVVLAAVSASVSDHQICHTRPPASPQGPRSCFFAMRIVKALEHPADVCVSFAIVFFTNPLKQTSGVALRKSCSCAIVRSLVSFMLITILG